MPRRIVNRREEGYVVQWVRVGAGCVGRASLVDLYLLERLCPLVLRVIEREKTAAGRSTIQHSAHMFGEWLSLVEHLLREQGVGGSNPLSPTIPTSLKVKNLYRTAFLPRYCVM